MVSTQTVAPPARPFQICGACRHAWSTWDRFVLDPGVRVLGLQSVFTHPEANLLVFEHYCGSSISILSRRLRYLLPVPEPGASAGKLVGTERCQGHCRHLEDLEACYANCSNARDRKLLRLVQRLNAEARESVTTE